MRAVSMATAAFAMLVGTTGVMGGYLSLNMTAPTQCGTSLVQWWGDQGPYHLLLTPTQHVEHGYNVWLPSIDAGINSYNLSINQPAGTHFLLTMWGASGIEFAGTTDVMQVGAPMGNKSNSCFLSDAEILSLYSFSFNISDNGNDFPPQCSNLTLSWPTSLESNITTGAGEGDDDEGDVPYDPSNKGETPSSSKHQGNTTYPPSLFGVIPLGNSFSIPITYSRESRFSKYLPPDALSDNPTTWTTHGVTSLNWTIDMAKGTRFILVAGIGSDSQWASGGSSELKTVGQGGTNCQGGEDGGHDPPSVTATPTSTSDQSTPTAVPDQGNNKKHSTVAVTAIASVISVLGTLIVAGFILYLCRRRKRRHRRSLASTCGGNSPGGSPIKKGATGSDTLSSGDRASTIDLVALQGRSAGYDQAAPGYTPEQLYPTSPAGPSSQPMSPGDSPIYDSPQHRSGQPRPSLQINPTATPIRGFEPRTDISTFSGTYSSPISPMGTGFSTMNPTADSSQAAPLLAKSQNGTPSSAVLSPSLPPRIPPPLPRRRPTNQPLQLHDRTNSLDVNEGEESENDDFAPLKVETIAALDGQGSGQDEGPSTPSSRRRRRRRDEEEPEIVVHRDAGRVDGSRQEGSRRRVELPPRYEELDWEAEERQRREGNQTGDPS